MYHKRVQMCMSLSNINSGETFRNSAQYFITTEAVIQQWLVKSVTTSAIYNLSWLVQSVVTFIVLYAVVTS